jgi:hypothetical protein
MERNQQARQALVREDRRKQTRRATDCVRRYERRGRRSRSESGTLEVLPGTASALPRSA